MSCGPGLRLGVELHAEVRPRARADAFVGAVVDVHEPRLPVAGQRVVVDRVAVILAGDVAAARQQILHRLVHAAMAVGQLVGVARPPRARGSGCRGRRRRSGLRSRPSSARTCVDQRREVLRDRPGRCRSGCRRACARARARSACHGARMHAGAAREQRADDVVLRAGVDEQDRAARRPRSGPARCGATQRNTSSRMSTAARASRASLERRVAPGTASRASCRARAAGASACACRCR